MSSKEEVFSLSPLNPIRVVIALSGGRDSMTLLDVVTRLFHRHDQYLIARVDAVYIHHGLSPNATAWEEHCRQECDKRRIPFHAIAVNVKRHGIGIEAAARDARYRALEQYARQNDMDVILTAHHEDDRIETFLLQWMRGAGPEGLAAFPTTRELVTPGQLASSMPHPILLIRPWCGILRADIERYAKNKHLNWVEDESNDSPKYLRNRIRHEVVPMLEAIRPGFRAAAARSVGITAEAVEVLRSVAAEDVAKCRAKDNPHALHIASLLRLIPARQAWCLRAWMQEEGMRIPNHARLEDGLRQIRETHSDTMLTIRVHNKEVRRWGANLIIRDAVTRSASGPRDARLFWQNQQALELPNWNGEILIVPCRPGEPGIAADRLRHGLFEVRVRKGGEKLKLWPNRPSKYLKDLFAEAKIPSFDRSNYPILWLDGKIVFVAGLGMELRMCDDESKQPNRVRFIFRPEASLWGTKTIRNLEQAHSAQLQRYQTDEHALLNEPLSK
ncbi:tRNA(Ile)-lysidine synthetase [gut metagenome]|uniref:tRNA(Ile)-lysidine synthetase n=1 Tax=gut metagenome TaxID=749906 RepID=J9CZH7_9ZZZZ